MIELDHLNCLIHRTAPDPPEVYVRDGRRYLKLDPGDQVDVTSMTRELVELIEPILERAWRQTVEETESDPEMLLAFGVLDRLHAYWGCT